MGAHQARRDHQAQQKSLSQIHQHIRLLRFRASRASPTVLFHAPPLRPRPPSTGHPPRPRSFHDLQKFKNKHNFNQIQKDNLIPARFWTHTKVRIHLSCLPFHPPALQERKISRARTNEGRRMKQHFWKTTIMTMGLALCLAPGAGAYTTGTTGSFTYYFGEAAGIGENTASIFQTSNGGKDAIDAENAFLLQLSQITTETFKDFEKTTDTLLSNTASIIGITDNDIKTDASSGRYPIYDTTYIATKNTFSILFTSNISAFGFYGIDIADFDSEDLQIKLYSSTSNIPLETFSVNSAYNTHGSVLYFGFYSTTEKFNKIEFINSANDDVYGFDKMSIGTPVPLPPTALMLGSGLLGVAGLLRIRRRPQ